MKYGFLSILSTAFTVAALLSGCSNPTATTPVTTIAAAKSVTAGSFANGADIGWLNQLEGRGVAWYNSSGTKTDPVTLLKNAGVDSIRLRCMVNPGRYSYFTYSGGGTSGTVNGLLGYCDQAGVVYMAKRCAALGLRIMVDFHFSDTWASDEAQTPPLAWQSYTLGEMETAVAGEVTTVLTALKNEGVTPEWVQLGNEITDGILFGSNASGYVTGTSGWFNLAGLLNAGYAAVKAVDSSCKVVLHLDKGGEKAQYEWWFDNYKAAGGKWDVVGMSFYPYWQPNDTVAMLTANMKDMVSRYGKQVMVCEVGGLYSAASTTQTLVANVKAAVQSVPNGNGLGFFYWEPESNPNVLPGGYVLGATTEIATNKLQYTSAITSGF